MTADGQIASFAVFSVDQVAGVGELDPVGTRRAHQGIGLSRALLRSGLAYLRRTGMRRAVVRTAVGNEAAIAAYRSAGFAVVDYLHRYEKA